MFKNLAQKSFEDSGVPKTWIGKAPCKENFKQQKHHKTSGMIYDSSLYQMF